MFDFLFSESKNQKIQKASTSPRLFTKSMKEIRDGVKKDMALIEPLPVDDKGRVVMLCFYLYISFN